MNGLRTPSFLLRKLSRVFARSLKKRTAVLWKMQELLATLLSGVVCEHAAIEAAFAPFVDRDLKRVSLVERSILFLGTFELMRAPETPYRVVLNEAIELAKRFGSGYRFTNAVLERVAEKVRETEFKADHAEKSQKDGN